MAEKRLNIIKVKDSTEEFSASRPTRQLHLQELKAKFERLWLLDPEQFNPLRNCMQKERLNRTMELLRRHVDLTGIEIADIGCGSGVFSRRLRDAGAHVMAVDIAENALKILKQYDMQNIEAKQEVMPSTSLPDQAYDAIVCMELIAELPAEEYRLFFSELSRLIKLNHSILCSSAIDIYTEGGTERLLELAETEFYVNETFPSYHALHIRLRKFFENPPLYVKAWKDTYVRQHELRHRSKWSYFWFKWNSTPWMMWLWLPTSYLVKPILYAFKHSRGLLLALEKICRFFWDNAGISHLIFVGTRLPIQIPEPITPIERPKRKEIWE